MTIWKLCPFALFQLGSLAADAQTGVVTAKGIKVPGATVKATQGDKTLVTVTDENGHYKLDGLANGAWVFEVQMFRFETARREVQVQGPSNLDWNLSLRSLNVPSAPVQVQGNPRGRASSQWGRSRQGTQRGGFEREQQATAPNGRPGQAQQGEYSIPELTNQIETSESAMAALADPEVPSGMQSDSANEAFLLNGTLSRGLQQVASDPHGDFGAGFGRRSEEDPNVFGLQDGPPGPSGLNGPGGGAEAGGRGGGHGGNRGGGGFGGRPPGDRAALQAQRRAGGPIDNGMIGNRRNRGQQSIHGTVRVVLQNAALDARPFAVNGQAVAKPSYAKGRYSVQIGGPLMFPKLFRLSNTTFNFNYTGNRADNLSTQVGSVPVLAERTGDFSAINAKLFDPLTHMPFPSNVIPSSRFDNIAVGLLNYIPKPNQVGSCSAGINSSCNAQNYQFTITVPTNNQSVGLRLGQSLGKKDRLSLNFQFQDRSGLNPQIFGFLDSTQGRGINTNLSWIHTFAPRMFNILGATFNRNRTNALPFFANSSDVAATLGILGTSTNPLNYGPPNLNFTNFAALADGSASLTRVQSSSLNEGLTWMRGKHSLSFGGVFQRNQNNVQTDSNGRGTNSFTGLATSGFDAGGQPLAGTGFDFADFLLGFPNSSSIRFGDTSTYFRSTNYSFFGQDDWRMKPKFSITFGLRYEFFGVPYERYGHEANLDIAPGFTAVAQVTPGQSGPYTGNFPSGLVNPDRNNFAPRLGIAWRPWTKGKAVVRAGYGWYYNGAAYNAFSRNLVAQPPFANSNSIITSSQAVLMLADSFVLTPPGKTITNTYAVDRFYRVPYAQTWNFSIQQDLPYRLVLQVSYLGTKGTRLDTLLLPNRAAPGGSPLSAEENRVISDATGFTFEASNANSIYHSARVSLVRRFSRGASFNIDYVFAKSIDDAATFGGGLAQNEQDISAERSLSNFDHRHNLNATYVVTSPFGHNTHLLTQHQLMGKFLEDWTLSGGIHAQTGSPLNPRVAGNQSDSAGTGAVGTTRPNATGLPVEDGSAYFNTAAFILPRPGQFGNAGRNTIPGPGLVAVSASFGRSFGLGERRTFEFRFDATNLLNQVNISTIGTTINASTYGLPLSAVAMRSMSVTMRFRF